MNGKEKFNGWNFKEYLKYIGSLLLKCPIRLLQGLLFFVPLKKNRIILYSFKQHGYSCSLKYLTEYWKDQKSQLEILWVVREQEDFDLVSAHGVPVAMLHSWKHFIYRHRAGIVITNDEFYPMFRKRRGQLYVNTWHGAINYKKIGYAGIEFSNPVQALMYRMNNPCPDVFLSGSRSFTHTASEAFGFPREVFLECGLPRNDILCAGADERLRAQIREKLGLQPGDRILLYAPTFRKGGIGPGAAMDYEMLRRCLQERFGGRWVIALREHYFVRSRQDIQEDWLVDVSDYEDAQELILISDCLISDYSSCMWDFSLTGKPCFVFAPDYQAYTDTDRSFFIPMEKWPYPLSSDMETLCRNIRDFDPDDYARRINAHRQEFGSFDRGAACRSLTELLEKYITK